MLSQLLAVIFYVLEYRKLYFSNPAFIAFWLLESLAYLLLSYTASLDLGTNVRIFWQPPTSLCLCLCSISEHYRVCRLV